MIPRGDRHHAARQVLFGAGIDEVRRAADFERSAALEVLTLEKRPDSGALVEGARCQHRRAMRNGGDALRGFPYVGERNAHWRSSTTIVSTGSRSVIGNRSKVPPGTSFTSTALPLASSVALRILGSFGNARTSSFQSRTWT